MHSNVMWTQLVIILLIGISKRAASSSSQTQDNQSQFQQNELIEKKITHINETEAQFETLTYNSFKLGVDHYTEKHLKESYRYFYPKEQHDYDGRSVAIVSYYALIAKYHAQVYSDFFLHRYDNYEELKISGGPQVDQEKCLRHLRHMNYRATRMREKDQRYNSADMNFYRIIDTFGTIPSGQLLGHGSWLGTYEECLSLKLDTPEEKTPMRYCIASFKHNSWPINETISKIVELKASICLPKACDSLNYKNKFALVQELVEFQARRMDLNQASLSNLYCLPDEESNLRIWWREPKTATTVFFLSLWISILIYSTCKYNRYLKEQGKTDGVHAIGIGLTKGFSINKLPKAKKSVDRQMEIYKSLSITNNLSQLFNTSKTSSLMQTGDRLKKAEGETSEQEDISQTDLFKKPIVDLSIVEGIKVIAMCYVICGHVLMCLAMIMKNGREMAQTSSPSFFIVNLVPAFAVNTFFTITGLLTSYLMFKQNQSHSFITSPIKWFAFLAYRYLRIMPMYVVVVMYSKYLAKYMSSGPFWDYATSALSTRRNCENESWLWTLLFAANFKPPLDHCIPSAWYLANDFQFFIITPIFLAALYKRPKFGELLLKGCIISGYLGCFYKIFTTNMIDIKPVARFMPHGFKTYVAHLCASYTQPQYRMPAYLCGLMIGYVLYKYEQEKIKFLVERKKNLEVELKEPEWSEWFIRNGPLVSFYFIFGCCITPIIGSILPMNQLVARLLVAFIMPSYHMAFSLSVGIYVLLATTGYGIGGLNSFLASPLWKPFARLSLCAVLINIEVILYIIQSKTQLQQVEGFYQTALDLICIILTYLVSIVLCVLFEAPLRAALNHLLTFAIERIAKKRKTD